MYIDIGEIRKTDGQTFHFDLTVELPPLDVDNSEICFEKPLSISLDIRSTGKELIFTGKIKGDTQLVCNRCLERYGFCLDTDFKEEFCHASDLDEFREEGRNTDDIHVFEGNRINLEDIIRESVLLSIPMKSVCDEDCRGLCPVCGKNLNKDNCGCEITTVDPRLADLKKYFER